MIRGSFDERLYADSVKSNTGQEIVFIQMKMSTNIINQCSWETVRIKNEKNEWLFKWDWGGFPPQPPEGGCESVGLGIWHLSTSLWLMVKEFYNLVSIWDFLVISMSSPLSAHARRGLHNANVIVGEQLLIKLGLEQKTFQMLKLYQFQTKVIK